MEVVLGRDVTLFIFEFVRGGKEASQNVSNIAIDDVYVKRGDCSMNTAIYMLYQAVFIFVRICVVFKGQVRYPEPPYNKKDPQQHDDERPSNISSPYQLSSLPWLCDFGTPDSFEMCGLTQDQNDVIDWTAHSGGTFTQRTGPPASGFQRHGKFGDCTVDVQLVIHKKLLELQCVHFKLTSFFLQECIFFWKLLRRLNGRYLTAISHD